MIHAAAIDGTILWSIVVMSVVFAIGAGAAVWGFLDGRRQRRHAGTAQAHVTVPAQRVPERPLVHR